MRLSVIDIGTNTVLLLVAEVDPRGELTSLYHGHEIARLGMGVDEHRRIRPDAVERASAAIKNFVSVSQRYNVDKIVACGTSALRDAENRKEILAHIKRVTGVEVRILSGDEEAALTYLGAAGEFLEPDHPERFAVLDIGGGSTEITTGVAESIETKRSHDIGCVRLTERFLKSSPPSSKEIDRAVESINEHLGAITPLHPATRLIGVAGTLTTLGGMDLNLPTYDPLKVSGHRLTRETIRRIFDLLKVKTVEQIRGIPQILPGRADILLAGVLILIEVMKRLECDEIIVSDRGLRYGVALREAIR